MIPDAGYSQLHHAAEGRLPAGGIRRSPAAGILPAEGSLHLRLEGILQTIIDDSKNVRSHNLPSFHKREGVLKLLVSKLRGAISIFNLELKSAQSCS